MERRRENLKPKVAYFIKIGILDISGEMAQVLQEVKCRWRVCCIYIKDFTICRPSHALIFLSQLSDFHLHVSIISLLYTRWSMVMPLCLLQNYVFSRLLCSMEKNCGVFFPTYLSVQLTALEAKLLNSHWTSAVHWNLFLTLQYGEYLAGNKSRCPNKTVLSFT